MHGRTLRFRAYQQPLDWYTVEIHFLRTPQILACPNDLVYVALSFTVTKCAWSLSWQLGVIFYRHIANLTNTQCTQTHYWLRMYITRYGSGCLLTVKHIDHTDWTLGNLYGTLPTQWRFSEPEVHWELNTVYGEHLGTWRTPQLPSSSQNVVQNVQVRL